MNLGEIQYFLTHPEELKTADAHTFEELVIQYPYFQTAYLLLAKRAKLNNDPSFETILSKAAIHATDRRKLYELLNQPLQDSPGVKEHASEVNIDIQASTNDEELGLLLQSVHDRKQQFISNEEKKEFEDTQKDEADRILYEELKSSGSEFAPRMMDLTENTADDQEITTADSEMIQKIEQEAGEQEQYFLQEEFLLLNETGGGGSEYIPLEESLPEESGNTFVEEYDPEMQSNVVIEEEFIWRDLDSELKEKKLLKPSHDGKPVQDEDLIEVDQSQSDYESESEKAGADNLESQNEIAPPAKEIEIQEHAAFSESTTEKEPALEIDLSATTTDFRINENVDLPGKFLPGKSYSFIEWLQFFKLETQSKQVSSPSKSDSESSESEPEAIEIYQEPIPAGLPAELETIDRIISTLKSDDKVKVELQLAPADLAQKSLELDEEMATETLAEIYENQGLYNKAISMYARLSLKFPEKSLFFAGRIKELKSKK
ncbi:MAG: hypothetical protein H0V65_00980 [Chitinophagales bacterium]|nr:hypothetical protein [Chitinophagales bacterium]